MWSHWDNEKINGYFLFSGVLHFAFFAVLSWVTVDQLRPLNQGTIEFEIAPTSTKPTRLAQKTQIKDESIAPTPLAPKKTVRAKRAKKTVPIVKKVRKLKTPKPKKKILKTFIAKKLPKKKLPKKRLSKKRLPEKKLPPVALKSSDLSSDIAIPVEKKQPKKEQTLASDSFADKIRQKLDQMDAEEDLNHEQALEDEISQEIALAEEKWVDEPLEEKKAPENKPLKKKVQLVKQDALVSKKKEQKGVLQKSLPSKVRDISELRSLRGNRPPVYSLEDRFAKKEGTVVLQAYVTKRGILKNFKLLNSAGHRSLDRKTLKAFKKYRFHSGQEGWIQMAFIWDLKGNVQQYPTKLRRRAQYKNAAKILGH